MVGLRRGIIFGFRACTSVAVGGWNRMRLQKAADTANGNVKRPDADVTELEGDTTGYTNRNALGTAKAVLSEVTGSDLDLSVFQSSRMCSCRIHAVSAFQSMATAYDAFDVGLVVRRFCGRLRLPTPWRRASRPME